MTEEKNKKSSGKEENNSSDKRSEKDETKGTKETAEEKTNEKDRDEAKVDIEEDEEGSDEEQDAETLGRETGRKRRSSILKKARVSRNRPRTEEGEWIPRTTLGKLVSDGKINKMSEALRTGLPLREPQIVDRLMGDTMVDEVLKVNMVQRMTDSGRRTRFSITVVVGNGDGYVGLGSARGKEVGPTIKKAIENAKINMIELVRGCGSWECGCMTPHSLPFMVTGKSGSTTVTLRAAPRGVGLAVGDVAKKILKLAGIKDAWGFSRGQTKTTVNNAKAVMDALKGTTQMRVQKYQRMELKHLSGPTQVIAVDEETGGGEAE